MKKLFFLLLILSTLSLNGQQLHKRNKGLPCINKTFQLYFHVALDSFRMANTDVPQIESAISSMNKYFEPICVRFEFCKMDTIYNYEFDSLGVREESAEIRRLYHANNRINVYLLSELDDPAICGFASVGGIKGSGSGSIFIKKPGCLNGGVLAHEMGHLWGLVHTFEGNGVELVDGSNCKSDGDRICDTPADPYDPEDDVSEYIKDCEFISLLTDANGQLYQPDVGNIMSYYGCDCGFTRGQYLKMANSYLNSSFKMW